MMREAQRQRQVAALRQRSDEAGVDQGGLAGPRFAEHHDKTFGQHQVQQGTDFAIAAEKRLSVDLVVLKRPRSPVA
jgi:hypothetical protein